MIIKQLIGWLGLAFALPAAAQFYEPLQFRSNDPFLFCHDGYEPIQANACWIPLPPYTGAWIMTGVCNPPNQYGRSWTDRDMLALEQYFTVCPQARNSGEWSGNGAPQSTPFQH